MTARIPAIVAGAVAIVLAAAQDVVPGLAFYHSWQYALVLAVASIVLVPAGVGALRDARSVPRAWMFALAFAGAATAAGAGLASGLLGPDTATVIGTPGTVVPVPALGSAAFFGAADAASIARGDGSLVLRTRGGPPLDVSAGHHLFGESVVGAQRRVAAFVEVWDAAGAHLTITQPTGAAFLSPVLLFRERQRIGAFDVPFDAFATPGRARAFRALYFTPRDLANFKHAVADTSKPALIVTAADEHGTPLGIVLAQSGSDARIGNLRLRATLGTYPALSIASVPPLWALAGGSACFALGLLGAVIGPRRTSARATAAAV